MPAFRVPGWRFFARMGAAFALFFFRFAAMAGTPFDAAPFGLPLPDGDGPGLMWEDPRELHEVRVTFRSVPADPARIRLQYWGSWWPERHLPKDREPGGGDVGWMELGNWWKDQWRDADTTAEWRGTTVTFRFQPVNVVEFPQLTSYPAPFRFTLKLRVAPDVSLPVVQRLEAITDSSVQPSAARVVWREPAGRPRFSVFNGSLLDIETVDSRSRLVRFVAVRNPDPNTFDRTLVTVRRASRTFTFQPEDLRDGPLFLPDFGAAVLAASDARSYDEVERERAQSGRKTLRQRVAERPEQTWQAAWTGMPRKKSDIYFPMGLDGGRQRFRLQPDGRVDFRHNDSFLRARPGVDTARLDYEPGPITIRFGFPPRPEFRTLAEECLPIVTTRWSTQDVTLQQTAFVTELGGRRMSMEAPPGDTTAVWMARFDWVNRTNQSRRISLPLMVEAAGRPVSIRVDEEGRWWSGARLRGGMTISNSGANRTTHAPGTEGGSSMWSWDLPPGATQTVVVKVPYLALQDPAEQSQLAALDFDREHRWATEGWRLRLDAGARLSTPEPMLNEFHRSVAMHLLVNCEREPGSTRRFARVGSFSYGAYGNESCMMVLDLERRGFHREAEECLEAWLHYQGTVALPGSFASHEGVLYGAGGYEAGGYNQHHGWILWMLAEHYRFTRDRAWLEHAAPGIVRGADWILREVDRTKDRHPLERGLLPAGSLEDIGDWWTWLSTSCYVWRGLDNASWALAEISHPDARRIRRAAQAYHQSLLRNFREARDRSPVVRLRDGTAVPKFPSHVHRRGRCFGWICETLEGSLHLLITRAIDGHSREAEWILDDYEDNLYLSNQYGYLLEDFDRHWFDRGGMSMQACLLLQVEPWLYRDDIPLALRGLFNAQAASYFPDVRMNTEHALPFLDDWRGDHFKSSDEANCAGWLRQLLIREETEEVLWVGQGIPRAWLGPGSSCGIDRGATWFGPMSVHYRGEVGAVVAELDAPTRNPPQRIRVRFRLPDQHPIHAVTVNGKPWRRFDGDWVDLPGTIGRATIRVTSGRRPGE
ncbi:MAG: hypothetical protein JNK85_22375 [Verrucomicrobiales bacterium]|nr:hypothetical protein [Verrucomicrobiales bacterium]